MSNTSTPIRIPVHHSSNTSSDTPEEQSQDETEANRQGSGAEVADVDQQQQIVARELRAQKMQELRAQDRAKTTKAVYTGPPPKKIGIGAFIIMFCFALMKDLIDFVDFGIMGTVLNIVPIMGVLLTVAFTGGSLMDFMNKRKYVLGSGAALEFIPIIGFLPIWTLSIFWLWLESRKGKKVSGKAATRLGRRVAKGGKVQGAIKRLGLKKG